jgi:hypothetical protein
MLENRKNANFVHLPYQIKKKALQSVGSPILMVDSFPKRFRKFCCFVAVETKNTVKCGSGILTDIGILTALHLFNDKNEITEKWATFLLENDKMITVDLGEFLIKDEKNDIAILYHPVLCSYFKPIRIGNMNKNLLFFPEDLWAFGCPRGLLGKVWRPKFVGISENKIYTRGFGCPGVSGGGILTRYENKWYVWAVHSGLYLHGWTLVSSIVNLNNY